MLIVTRDKVKPVDTVADILVEDEVYILIAQNEEFRNILLTELGKDQVVVDRLGSRESDMEFRREVFQKPLPTLDVQREVGYYTRLS